LITVLFSRITSTPPSRPRAAKTTRSRIRRSAIPPTTYQIGLIPVTSSLTVVVVLVVCELEVLVPPPPPGAALSASAVKADAPTASTETSMSVLIAVNTLKNFMVNILLWSCYFARKESTNLSILSVEKADA